MMSITSDIEATKDKIWEELAHVKDPEIPVLSIVDLGMITHVGIDNNIAQIKMTPTFAACPAIEMLQANITKQIKDRLDKLKLADVNVSVDYDIQWNSNRISEEGKKILKKFGLAPPPIIDGEVDMDMLHNVECPHCDSHNTEMKSTFGSTLCRAIHYCNDCKQSFEQFKPVS